MRPNTSQAFSQNQWPNFQPNEWQRNLCVNAAPELSSAPRVNQPKSCVPFQRCKRHPLYPAILRVNNEFSCPVCYFAALNETKDLGFSAISNNIVCISKNLDQNQLTDVIKKMDAVIGLAQVLFSRLMANDREKVTKFLVDNQHSVFDCAFVENSKRDDLKEGMTTLIELVNNSILEIGTVSEPHELTQLQANMKTCREYIEDAIGQLNRNMIQNPSRATANTSTLEGTGISSDDRFREVKKFTQIYLYLTLKNFRGKQTNAMDARFQVKIRGQDNLFEKHMNCTVDQNGIVECRSCLYQTGAYEIHAEVNGQALRGSPFPIRCVDQFDYQCVREPFKSIGPVMTGNEPHTSNHLQRPWGVYITDDRYLLIVERKQQHAVKIFDPNYNCIGEISSPNNDDSRFNRLTKAIALDKAQNNSAIFVCDKSTEVIYKLAWDGTFLAKTEKKLHSPWDMCFTKDKTRLLVTNSKEDYVVISVFDLDLKHRANVGVGMHGIRELRGICLGFANHVLVSDFKGGKICCLSIQGFCDESNRVQNLESKFKFAIDTTQQSYGPYPVYNHKSEDREQGICLSSYGQILMCDSRMRFLRVFTYGEHGEELKRGIGHELKEDFTPQDVTCHRDIIYITNLGRTKQQPEERTADKGSCWMYRITR